MVLCYNKESGKLYHANSAPATDVLFNSYEDKGFKESEKINVAGTGFSFVIKSNFGYGNASYLLFKATYESNQLFDFETDCCSKNSLPFFSVPPTTENWDKLFCKIEEVFSQRETWNVNSFTSNPQPIGFSGILLAKRQNSFYCTYFLHNRNVADTKSPYPIKRLEVIRWFNQKSMVFNQSLS